MKSQKIFIALILVLILLLVISCSSWANSPIPTAKGVDLNRYMGTWYEIARTDNPFQRGTHNAIAQYYIKSNGDVDIVNSAIDDKTGELKVSNGSAFAPDKNDPSKLRVTFFHPFYSDYNILVVDNGYKWSIVSSANYKYLWLLAREKTISDSDWIAIKNATQNQPKIVKDFIVSAMMTPREHFALYDELK